MQLLSRLNYCWRLLATGLAFVELGGGGLLLALFVIPLATATVAGPQIRARRAQGIVRASFRLFIFLLRLLGVIRVEVIGAARLASCRGTLVIANHPTLLDVVLLMSLVPNAQCVVKHQLWRNPFLRHIVTAAEYIRNDLEPEAFIESCRRALAAGRNLIIFPEGTRSEPGRRLHFQRGFAHIATMCGADMQLVTISCDPVTLVRGQPWYAIPIEAPTFRIEVGERVEAAPFLDEGPRALGARRLVSHLESYYVGKLQHG